MFKLINYILPFMFVFSLFCFPLEVVSKLEPPKIPKRPTIEELRKSLDREKKQETRSKKQENRRKKRE